MLLMEKVHKRVRVHPHRRVVRTRCLRQKLPIRIDMYHPDSHLILHSLYPIHTRTHPSTNI